MSEARRPPVGSVHEETARLFEALEGAAAAWSGGRRRAPEGGEAAGPDADGHLPVTCGVCPLCQALARLGRQRPEVLAHLGDAVQALGAAVAALATDPGRDEDATGGGAGTGGSAEPARPRAERIDVTD